MATECLLQDYKSLKCLYVHAGGLGLNSCGFRLESKWERTQSVRTLCEKLNQKKRKENMTLGGIAALGASKRQPLWILSHPPQARLNQG